MNTTIFFEILVALAIVIIALESNSKNNKR